MASPDPRLRLHLLGPPRVELDGAPIEVDTRKAIALLAYLAVTGRPQSRDHIAGLLWPEYRQERARAALRRTLSTLRSALGGGWVTADRNLVVLDPAGLDSDVGAFRAAMAEVAGHAHPDESSCSTCLRTLEAAVKHAGGSFLEGFTLRDAAPFEEWQQGESESLTRELSAALDSLVRVHSSRKDIDAALAAATRRLSLDPLNEATHRDLMGLYAAKGERSAAVHQYRECVGVLERELGVAPLPETTALYEAITQGDERVSSPPEVAAPPARAGYPLVGRERERYRLLAAYDSIRSDGLVIVIEGEAGIGKSRLAEEVMTHARDKDATIVRTRCHEGEAGIAYAVIGEILQQLPSRQVMTASQAALLEAARLVPELATDGPPAPASDPGAPARFHEGLREVITSGLVGSSPGVMFIDDLHWADSASLEVLGFIARRLEATSACLVVAWRSEEAADRVELMQLPAGAPRAMTISPERLRLEEVRTLVGAGATTDVDPLATRLHEESEGLPLFVVEYLSAMGSTVDDWSMPAGIVGLLRSRLARVDELARQVLGSAAVIDRTFDFETVWRVSGRSELETVDALDDLVSHGLVEPRAQGEPASPTFDFSHHKTRELVYSDMSPARRRVLHRRAADALQASSAPPASIAGHYRAGGMEAEAAELYASGGWEAGSLYANREAVQHFESALALGHHDAPALHESIADMRVLMGEYSQAAVSYETAAALGTEAAVPRLEHKLGNVHLRRGDWELAESHLEAVLDTAEPGESVLRARALADLSLVAYRQGSIEEARRRVGRALDAATGSGDERALVQAHNIAGILAKSEGDIPTALDHLEASLELAGRLEDPGARVAALNNLALSAQASGDVGRAVELTAEALSLCSRMGDRHREAALHNNMADLLHASGDEQTSMEHLKQATVAFAEIGAEPAGMLPEVWKLVEW
jgi:DNA-binding SARP family transcriptional activator/tetratricopeptide (TPR) repeat protein